MRDAGRVQTPPNNQSPLDPWLRRGRHFAVQSSNQVDSDSTLKGVRCSKSASSPSTLPHPAVWRYLFRMVGKPREETSSPWMSAMTPLMPLMAPTPLPYAQGSGDKAGRWGDKLPPAILSSCGRDKAWTDSGLSGLLQLSDCASNETRDRSWMHTASLA